MRDKEEVKLGIVGCGGISYSHGDASINSQYKIRFVACCDIDDESAKKWARKYNCDGVYTNYEEMISKEDLDGILLATWPNQHREQIEKSLVAGAKNILCEKSLTLSGKEALEIWNLIEKFNAFLMEGFMYRHHPAIHKIDSLLSSSDVGKIDNVRAVFSSYDPEDAPTDTTRNWRQRKECGGGVPYDFTCYAVNACNHFVKAIPERVFATGTISEKYNTINRLYGIIEYSNKYIGIIESSKNAKLSQELQITCSHGILNLPIAWLISDEISIEHQHQLNVERCVIKLQTYSIPKANAYQLQLENFADVIKGRKEPVIPLIESVVNIYTLEALVNSLLEKKPIEIILPDEIYHSIIMSK